MGPMVFFLQAQTPTCTKKDREIVTDICGVGATLMGSLNFGQNPPQFSQGHKKIILQWH